MGLQGHKPRHARVLACAHAAAPAQHPPLWRGCAPSRDPPPRRPHRVARRRRRGRVSCRRGTQRAKPASQRLAAWRRPPAQNAGTVSWEWTSAKCGRWDATSMGSVPSAAGRPGTRGTLRRIPYILSPICLPASAALRAPHGLPEGPAAKARTVDPARLCGPRSPTPPRRPARRPARRLPFPTAALPVAMRRGAPARPLTS